MKTAKLGAMFLISVLALAGIGAGYAAWTDTITIGGTINAGNVDLVVVGYSGTWVWKIYGGDVTPVDEIFVFTGPVELKPTNDDLLFEFPGSTIELISSAVATQAVDTGGVRIDDAVTMTFNNLFPCVWFFADVVFHYQGSIPVKINDLFITTSGLPANVEITTEMFLIDENGVDIGEIYEGTQLHNCQKIKVIIGVHLPQDNLLMGLIGSITGELEVVQWNEFPYPPID